MGVLILLGLMIAVFAFTLGVHLGKKVSPKSSFDVGKEASSLGGAEDAIPNNVEIAEQAKGAQQAADESLDQAAHDEVERTGIKLDVPRQVNLPGKVRSQNAGATTDAAIAEHKAEDPGLKAIPAAMRPAPAGKFTLQIGSHRLLDEAKGQADRVESHGLQPFLRAADIKGKGKWYRIFVGGYPSKDAATKAGNKYRDQGLIDSFVVSKFAE